MQKIKKNLESVGAKALQQWQRKYPNKTYNDLAKTEKGVELRQKIRQSLIDEQYCLCAYCTMRIKLVDSLNEHILPKGGANAVPEKQLKYKNLVAICRKNGCRCADAKDNRHIELTPLMDGCEKELDFRLSGEVKGKTERATKTIDILDLNNHSLVRRRKANIDKLLYSMELYYDSYLDLEHELDLEDDDILQIVEDDILEAKIQLAKKDNENCLTDFAPVLIYILNQILPK